jgi:hypothetical protein
MLADAPSALWPITDPAGATLVRDVSVNGRHLTPASSSVLGQAELFPGVPSSRAWNPASGSTENLSRANEAWMDPGAGDWLVTFFYRNADTVPISLESNGFDTPYTLDVADSGNGMLIYIARATQTGSYPTGTVRVWYAGSVLQNVIADQGGVDLTDGKAHQVWVEKRSGTVSIYVDGTLGQSGVRGTPTAVSGTLYVGRSDGNVASYRQRCTHGFMGVWSGVTIPALSRRAVYMDEARRAGVSY